MCASPDVGVQSVGRRKSKDCVYHYLRPILVLVYDYFLLTFIELLPCDRAVHAHKCMMPFHADIGTVWEG